MAFFHGFRGTFRRGCTPSIPVYKLYARHTAVDKIKRVFSRNFLPAFLVDDGTEQPREIHRALQIDLCFLHFCKADIGARKFGTAQVAFFQLRIAEHGLRKVAAGKIGFFEVRFRKARTAQTDAGKVLLFERTMIEHTVFECVPPRTAQPVRSAPAKEQPETRQFSNAVTNRLAPENVQFSNEQPRAKTSFKREKSNAHAEKRHFSSKAPENVAPRRSQFSNV